MRKLRGAAGPTAEDVRARIRRDMERLNPRARWRYRAALRRLMREAEGAQATGRLPARLHLSAAEMLALVIAASVFVAVLGVGRNPAAAAVAAVACGLAARLLAAPAGPKHGASDALDVVGLPPEGDPAMIAYELHLAAMAESRRAYYVGGAPDARSAAERSV
jgi:hypothetical protein